MPRRKAVFRYDLLDVASPQLQKSISHRRFFMRYFFKARFEPQSQIVVKYFAKSWRFF